LQGKQLTDHEPDEFCFLETQFTLKKKDGADRRAHRGFLFFIAHQNTLKKTKTPRSPTEEGQARRYPLFSWTAEHLEKGRVSSFTHKKRVKRGKATQLIAALFFLEQ
jgi:hypothetical protein